MSAEFEDLACGLVSKSYVQQGIREIVSRQRLIKDLLSRRRLPERGWDEASIERFISDLALMDSSNFRSNVGVGEREARVACPLVSRRNFGLAHGIGRSGDIAAEQPKAAGSTLLTRVCHFLVADALRLAGLAEVGPLQVLPLATGMTLTLSLLSLRASRPDPACRLSRQQRRFVLWFRIDQKTCLKAIVSANLEPVVIEPRRCADELCTDCDALQRKLSELGADAVCCVVSTTSCFAPRASDDVEAVARICAAAGVPHLINNAYGVASAQICRRITRACRVGRVDGVVQSTDKNFMVPVGGALLFAPPGRPALVAAVAAAYPGRASASAHLDLTLTLLHWGRQGWLDALGAREELYPYLRERLEALAAANGERVLATPNNPISLAMTLDTLDQRSTGLVPEMSSSAHPAEDARSDLSRTELARSTLSRAVEGVREHQQPSLDEAQPEARADAEAGGPENLVRSAPAGLAGGGGAEEAQGGASCPAPDGASLSAAARAGNDQSATAAAAPAGPSVTFFGSMLWQRGVSGVRVIARGKDQSIAGFKFKGYGSSCDDYPFSYMTAAAALGGSKDEVDTLVNRVQKCFAEFRKRM